MQKNTLQNKVVSHEVETKETRQYSFPNEWLVIEASTLEEALEKKEILSSKQIN